MPSETEQLAQIMSPRYADSLKLWSQQMTDPLAEHVEDVYEAGAEALSDDYVGIARMHALTTREVDLPAFPIETWRRWMYFDDYYDDTLVAKHDEIRLKTMTQARSEFARAQVAAANRQKMKTVIDAIKAPVYTGKNGTVPIAFPAVQTIVHGAAAFNTDKFDAAVAMLKTRGPFEENAGDRISCLWNAKGEESLMGAVEVASRDYTAQMVRDRGRIVSLGLVDFVRIEDLYDMKPDGSGNPVILERYLPFTAGSPNIRSFFMFVKKKTMKRWTPYSANGVVTWDQKSRCYRVSTDLSVGARRNHEFGAVEIQVTETA